MTHDDFESIAALDALGAATAGEATSLRGHLGSCVPCRRVRDEYERAAAMLALALEPIAPPAEIRERIAVPAADRRPAQWWLAAAATLFLALWGWREFGIRVARENDKSHVAEIARLKTENALLAERSARTIALTGQEIAPAASASVFLEPARRRAFVFFRDLPANPNDKSYQLWIIRADQPAPVSAGVFDVTESGSASLRVENLPVETEIKGLAVTLEPKGGVAQPTNTQFYVAGGI